MASLHPCVPVAETLVAPAQAPCLAVAWWFLGSFMAPAQQAGFAPRFERAMKPPRKHHANTKLRSHHLRYASPRGHGAAKEVSDGEEVSRNNPVA